MMEDNGGRESVEQRKRRGGEAMKMVQQKALPGQPHLNTPAPFLYLYPFIGQRGKSAASAKCTEMIHSCATVHSGEE